MRVAENIGHGVNSGEHDILCRERSFDIGIVACADPFLHDRVHFIAVFDTIKAGVEFRIVEDVATTHREAETAEAVGLRTLDVYVVAIASLEQVVDHAAGVTRTLAPDDVAELFIGGDMGVHETECAFVEGGIDHLPAPGEVAMAQRHHRAECRIEPGDAVGKADVGTRRRAVGVAGDMA